MLTTPSTSPLQKPAEIAKTDIHPQTEIDGDSAFNNSTQDIATLDDQSFGSKLKIKISLWSESINQKAKDYDFSADYEPLSNMDQQTSDQLAFKNAKYSDKELSHMYKGNRKASEQINKMDSHSIDPSQLVKKKQEQFVGFAKDTWNQKFPNMSIERMTHVKETAQELYEMQDVYQTLNEDEIKQSIRSTMAGIVQEEAYEASKDLAKKGFKAMTSLDYDGLMAAKDAAAYSTDIAYQYATLSDDKVDEYVDAFKEMQKVNGGQILHNMTVNTAINSGLNSSGQILKAAPHPVAKGVGIGLQGAAKLNQGVTTYSNVKTLSDVFDKKEAIEQEHPGAYGKILDGLKASANAKKEQQLISAQQLASQQNKDVHGPSPDSEVFVNDETLFQGMGAAPLSSYQNPGYGQPAFKGHAYIGQQALDQHTSQFADLDMTAMFEHIKNMQFDDAEHETFDLSAFKNKDAIQSQLDDDETESTPTSSNITDSSQKQKSVFNFSDEFSWLE
ncbi:hypothetical protein SG34_015090 [Thalassomonas viridans]|uniref:Uncharacterized protein n=1 Tax=Thalassomonas viridans TaxID=137584 RepID=A0AAE9YYM6_9GAMM|nr:hypothetical protein [Thalassomonas viridans]WDE02769.1 hypothetical protein SG34_015090 [Thalassomonas viridans]